jgi:hypothetical protein
MILTRGACAGPAKADSAMLLLALDAPDDSLFHFRDSDDGCETMSAFGLHDNVAEASESTGLRAMLAGQAKARPMPERL